ncbi:MAG: transporter substrate-binding domain-containing protein [Campylobacteraceae bacterium]|jgi:polar amino acid transport system substrate-binding protein|nr:transporter substrate-binding domain-containing protein [Campylobacteraceae bacterium]
MRKFLLVCFIFCAAIVHADDVNLWKKSTLNAILTRGELIVGLEPGYIPFEMKSKKGEVIGFDVDMAKAMADAMGVKLKLIPTEWDGLIPSLLTGKIDIIISGMTMFQERNLKVNFIEPYMTVGQTLLMAKKHKDKKWQDLDKAGYTIVTKFGVSAEVAARKIFKNAKIKTFGSEAESVQEVLNGNADAFIFDKPFNSMFMIQKGKDSLIHLTTELTYEPLGWAIRKGDPDFINWLENFLSQIKHDGVYDKMYEKWFVNDKWLPQVL